MTAPPGRTAAAIRTAVIDGATTCREVVAAHLDWIARRDRRIRAFQVLRADEALDEAEALDHRSDLADLSLAGVPVAVKDVVDVAGLPTTHGSPAVDYAPASKDSEVVARLRRAGAVVVGKTRGPELSLWGASDNFGGVARNPWNLAYSPAGSSGGSAAAVAAGMTPLAVGTDGLGSIRLPAASCGVVGVRPSSDVAPPEVRTRSGDVSRRHWFGMTSLGPLAGTVADAAALLDVLTGAGERYLDPQPPLRPLRIAVSFDPPLRGAPVARATEQALVAAAVALREHGHRIRRDQPSARLPDAVAVLQRWLQGAAQDVEGLGVDLDGVEPRTRSHVRAGRWWLARSPVAASSAQRWRDEVATFFERHDVLLTPVVADRPLLARNWRLSSWTHNVWSNVRAYPFTSMWNLADTPSASVPVGLGPRGVPRAVQVVAPWGHEARVLAVARLLERVRPWQRLAPVEP